VQNLKRTLLLLSLTAMMTFSLLPFGVVKAQQTPLFKVTIIAPGNANLVRRQWGQIFASSLQQLGIDAKLVYLNWAPVYDRVLTPLPDNVGKTYDNGGYDIELIGWTPGLKPEPRQLYYGGDPSFFAPDGQNYYLWNNTESNLLLDEFITATDPAVQDQKLQAWQSVFFNEMPTSQIMYSSTHAAVTPELGNYAWIYFNVQPSPQWLTGKTSVVYCSTGEIESLLPPLSNSWYDTIIFCQIMDGLEEVNNAGQNIPALVQSWDVSTDGFDWTYHLRSGVKWHDLYDFSADDVLFSLWALMSGNTGSQFVGYYQSVYGNRIQFTWENGTATWLNSTATPARLGSITATDSLTVDFTLPVLALNKPYGYISPYLLSFANNIIPKHIFEKLAPADWTDSVFNTGSGGPVTVPGIDNVTYYGPIGTGPYKWVEFNSAAQLVHLQKFDQYWNRTQLEGIGQFGVTDYYIRFIAGKTAAIAALKNEEVDMLDPNYQIETEVITPGAFDPSWATIMPLEGAGRQEIGYNMRHPIFGTGVDTPLGKATPSRAAEAARYVRQAFDYAIPRQLIIDNLLSGFGQPGATPMLPTQPYFNSSVTARPYDLAESRRLLQLAGYTVPGPPLPPALPSFILGMSLPITGYSTDPETGNPLANRELLLMETMNNATYDTTSTMIGRSITDLNGWYGFTVTPTATGLYYYYLFDSQAIAGTEWTYLRSLNVSSVDDLFTPFNTKIDDLSGQVADLTDQVSGLQGSLQTFTYVAAVAIVIAVVFGIFNYWMTRRGPPR
jgi:peptide/nickel transport system substrate-binding protein